MTNPKIGYTILAVLFVAAVLGLALAGPIPQSDNYHAFSDAQTWLGIANGRNMLSNLPFLLVGLLGMWNMRKFAKPLPYLAFFGGVALVGLGSGYYHFAPDSQTLIWDRLPMTLAFMALCSIVAAEFMNERAGQKALLPLLLMGLLSVAYWVAFNDLRAYILVQFYPVLALPIALIFFPSQQHGKAGYWLLACSYFIAKVFEHFDQPIHGALGFISGHSLKHLAAAAGIFALLLHYRKR